jgi:hypothetical protein
VIGLGASIAICSIDVEAWGSEDLMIFDQYSGQIYNYLPETRILPSLNGQIEKAESFILPLSLKKCPEH